MSWAGLPASPPNGYELATLREGDTLAGLEVEEAARRGVDGDRATLNRIGLEIARANGVPSGTAKTCAWARDLSAMVLATGGVRGAPSAETLNACEPGQGFVRFTRASRIYLPAGLRPRVNDAARAPVGAVSSSTGRAPVVLGVVLGALLLVRRVFSRKATA